MSHVSKIFLKLHDFRSSWIFFTAFVFSVRQLKGREKNLYSMDILYTHIPIWSLCFGFLCCSLVRVGWRFFFLASIKSDSKSRKNKKQTVFPLSIWCKSYRKPYHISLFASLSVTLLLQFSQLRFLFFRSENILCRHNFFCSRCSNMTL